MPITVDADLRRLSQEEFGAITFKVIGHAFDVHRELGRLFDEGVYQAELGNRCGVARTEVRVDISFGDFRKTYFIDLLVENGAVFEVKTVETFHDRHRAQLLNYLLLGDLAHGKLVNFRTSLVQHEFVNTSLTRSDLTGFDVRESRWCPSDRSSADAKQQIVAFLRDIGAGLDLELYREAVIHWLGGPALALSRADVILDSRRIGTHETIRTPDNAGIELTALKGQDLGLFEDHYQRLLNHLNLAALHCINVTRSVVTFQTLLPDKTKRR